LLEVSVIPYDELERKRRERAGAGTDPGPPLDGLGDGAWSPRFPAALLCGQRDELLGDFRGLSLRARALYAAASCLAPRREDVTRAQLERVAPELDADELDQVLAELRARGLLDAPPPAPPRPEPPPGPRPA
jgi:hypothetical protein